MEEGAPYAQTESDAGVGEEESAGIGGGWGVGADDLAVRRHFAHSRIEVTQEEGRRTSG